MRALIPELQRTAARWRIEHAQAAGTAHAQNLQLARGVAPAVATINLVFVLWLGTELLWLQDNERVTQWRLGLLATHLLMGLCFAGCAWAAQHWRDASNSRKGQLLPPVMASLAMLFVVALVTFDQRVSTNITPYLIGALACSVVVKWPPLMSAGIYAAAYVLFARAIGLTQEDAQALMTNRINGLVATGLDWALSVLLWRNFITITLQQKRLEHANAELQLKHRELQRLTRLDGLTGLYNRNTFVELTRQELARAQRQGSSTTVLLLDLDLFKHVNDTWGHPAGDAVLRNVSSVLNATVRHTDLVGRLGGEEFIILLPNTSPQASCKLAEKVRAAMERSPTAWEGQRIKATVSIGLAGTSASHNHDFDHLYTEADKALYRAKELGRNRVA